MFSSCVLVYRFKSTKEDGKWHLFLRELGRDVLKVEIYKPILLPEPLCFPSGPPVFAHWPQEMHKWSLHCRKRKEFKIELANMEMGSFCSKWNDSPVACRLQII